MSRRKENISVSDIETIEKMMDAGFTGVEIAKITGRSDSGTQKYMQMIRSVRKNGNINCHPCAFNYGIFAEFCKKRGYPEPVNIHPVAVGEKSKEDQKPSEQPKQCEMYHRLANDINFIAISLHDLAEFIYENFAKGGEKDESGNKSD